jgi:biotin-(acetyl-CoA carboxylase) ligase
MWRDALFADPRLNVEAIHRQLRTRTVGRRVDLYDEVASTNATLSELAGAPEGTVVLAESQTAGRGRGDTAWFSPPGMNLYASVLLKPAIAPAAVPVFTFIASLALADAIRALGLQPAVKWPNDVLVKGGKVAGVRAELVSRGDELDHVILGVGVNVNVTARRRFSRYWVKPGRRRRRSPSGSAGRSTGAPSPPRSSTRWTSGTRSTCATARRPAGAPGATWTSSRGAASRSERDGSSIDGRALGVSAGGHLQVEDAMARIHTVASGELRLLE